MSYIPSEFTTAAVINANTLFQNYDDEIQQLMADTGTYLEAEMAKVYTETGNVVTSGIGINRVENIASLKLQDGLVFNTIEVLGYYTKGDGGGGTFYWDSTSTETDNGGTVISATGITTGRWKRVFSGAVKVEWFGAKGDGVTDDTVAIQNAIGYCDTIEFNDSTYLVSETLYIDVSRKLLIGKSNTKIDFKLLPIAAEAVRIYSTGNTYKQTQKGIKNIELFNSLGTSRNTIGISYYNSVGYEGGNISHITIENVNLNGFGTAEHYGKDAYFIKHIGCDMWNNTVVIKSDGGPNMGENISYSGCAFFNSGSILDVTGTGSTIDMYFNQCSFDFSTMIFAMIDNAIINLSQCHIEWTSTVEDSFCRVQNNGMLIIDNSLILGNGAVTATSHIGSNYGGIIKIGKSFLHNLGNTTTSGYLIHTFSGKTNVENNNFLPIDEISKGLSNINLFHNKQCYITADTSAITKTRTGANIILSEGSSDNKLQIKKTYGVGSESGFDIFIHLGGASRLFVDMSFLGTRYFTGTMYIDFYSTNGMSFNDEGLPRYDYRELQGNLIIDTSTIANNHFSSYVSLEGREKHDYVVININLTAVVGSVNAETLEIVAYGI